jgi:hypothetical protein
MQWRPKEGVTAKRAGDEKWNDASKSVIDITLHTLETSQPASFIISKQPDFTGFPLASFLPKA